MLPEGQDSAARRDVGSRRAGRPMSRTDSEAEGKRTREQPECALGVASGRRAFSGEAIVALPRRQGALDSPLQDHPAPCQARHALVSGLERPDLVDDPAQPGPGGVGGDRAFATVGEFHVGQAIAANRVVLGDVLGAEHAAQ